MGREKKLIAGFIFSEYLNLTLGSKKKFYTRIVERPGLWMAANELNQLSTDLQSVVKELNIGDLNYGVIGGQKEAFDRAILTVVYDGKTGRPFAFNALSYMSCFLRGQQQDVIHLGLVVIDPKFRAKGLSWILYGLTTFLLFVKNRFRPMWISNVTQVPSIIGMVSESFDSVYPNPRAKTRRSFEHLCLAREIMLKHRHVFGVGPEAEFDDEKFVIKNAYTGGSDHLKKTFEVAPKHRNAIYNEYSKETLDYERGDDILQLGVMNLKTYYHYMIHSIPEGSLLIALYGTIHSLLESFVMPLVHWFTPSKEFGSLRARYSENKNSSRLNSAGRNSE